MKIEIRDFGPIHKFDFDLSKDLILIYGENNIGKSYALSLIYLLIKKLSINDLMLFPFYFSSLGYMIPEVSEKSTKKINLLEKSANGINIELSSKIIGNIFEDFFKSTTLSFNESLRNSFGQELNNLYTDNNFSIKLILNNMDISFIIKNEILISKASFHKKFFFKKSVNKRRYYETKDSITFYTHKQGQLLYTINLYIRDIISSLINEIRKEISDIYFLPASRSGLYQALSAFGQIIAELSQKRNFLHNKIELPSIPEPVTDYYLNISEIESKMERSNVFSKIASRMEKEILNGKIEYDLKTKKLYYIQQDTKLKLDLSLTSSMVSEIGPIVAYLKYILLKPQKIRFSRSKKKRNNPILLIEEPEAHLHPKVQVKLAEFFVEIINSGCKIIIISHSNYIFNKLNNLVLMKKLNQKIYSPYIMNQTQSGSIARLLDIDDLGVEDENFTDINEKLYYEQLNIIDKLNNDRED